MCIVFLLLYIFRVVFSFPCNCSSVESSWLMHLEWRCFFMELCLIHVL